MLEGCVQPAESPDVYQVRRGKPPPIWGERCFRDRTHLDVPLLRSPRRSSANCGTESPELSQSAHRIRLCKRRQVALCTARPRAVKQWHINSGATVNWGRMALLSYMARRGGRVWRICGRPGILDVTAYSVHWAICFAPDPTTQSIA